MPAVVNCPKCDAQVSLPVGADPVWQVRCPLCDKEFPLAEALDQAPPELIVVDRAGAIADTSPPWPDRSDSAAEDAATLPDFEIALDDHSAEIGEAGAATAAAVAKDSMPLDMAGDTIEVAGRLQHGMLQVNRGGHHWLGRVAGIVGGGVVGLMLGYFALLWLGGPSRDFLRLGPKLPSFILPAEFDRTLAMVPANGASPAPTANGNDRRSQPGPIEPEPTSPRPPFAGSEVASPIEPDAPPSSDHWPQGQPEPNREATAAELPSLEGHSTTPVRPAPWIVSQGPAFSVSEVNIALKAARTACDVLANNRLQDAQARPAMGTAYRTLCDLAEAVTYPEAGISAARIRGSRDAASDLVLQLAQTGAKRDELALIADRWIDAPQRSRRGIVLAGRVEQIRRNGATDLCALRIALSDQRTVHVLSRFVPRMAGVTRWWSWAALSISPQRVLQPSATEIR